MVAVAVAVPAAERAAASAAESVRADYYAATATVQASATVPTAAVSAKVGWATVVVLHSLISAFDFDLIQHALETANDSHVMVNSNKVLAGKSIHLIRNGAVVLIDWNRLKFELTTTTNIRGQYGQRLRH